LDKLQIHLRRDALAVLHAGVDAVSVDRLFKNLDPFEDRFPAGEVVILAVGKAAAPMTSEAISWLLRSGIDRSRISYDCTIPHGYETELAGVHHAGHPNPDIASIAAGKRVMDLAGSAKENDQFICLISGGGTALWSSPVEQILDSDLLILNERMLSLGLSIHEMNAIRSKLSRVGAGKLSLAVEPARLVSLIISDVPGDDASVIASGPTVSSHDQSLLNDLIRRKEIIGGLHPSTVAFLESASQEEPLTYEEVENAIIGSNAIAQEAMEAKCKELGYSVHSHLDLNGEASLQGKIMIEQLDKVLEPRSAIIAGGETFVTVQGDGRGGRNQELVLGAMSTRTAEAPFCLASMGTDGIDGFSEAAGAWIDSSSKAKAESLGLDSRDYLERNDSDAFFRAMDQQIITGPTHTNVMDIAIVLR